MRWCQINKTIGVTKREWAPTNKSKYSFDLIKIERKLRRRFFYLTLKQNKKENKGKTYPKRRGEKKQKMDFFCK